MKYIIKNRNGFTLIEALVTLVVMIIIFGVGAQILNTTMLSWNMFNLRKDMLYDSRLSMTMLLYDIRHADISQITTFNPTQFVFVDINNNNHDFFLSGTTLVKDSRILAENLQNGTGIQFSYLEPNGNTASLASDIRRVKIKLNFQKGGQTFSLESETRIRNI